MNATELISTEAPQAPTARANTPRPTGPISIDDTRPGPIRGHSGATVHPARAWLRRVLAESARGWALAAGVHPDLFDSRRNRITSR
jgi:hypothetical protein